ncbi:MAG: AIR synthase related protein, partial [Candidatus Latescibacterota bacterium]|nr:AIR synthase related protein [Candidatus Latescibacterota bacterium]
MNTLPPGKLPLGLLDDLLNRYTRSEDPRVLVGPKLGEDTAVIDFGETLLIAKTDPITFATDEIGYYAIHVCANDIATMGATPKWYLPTVLLPQEETDVNSVTAIFESIHTAATDVGITICGGHTEITTGLDRPIISGQMLGEVSRDKLITSDGLKVGDRILLTKGMGIEGTALLARELAEELDGYGIPADVAERSAHFLKNPGISVLPEARIACEIAQPHAMHDPTEGGVATALR